MNFSNVIDAKQFKSIYGDKVLFIFPARIVGGHELMALEIIKDHLSLGGECAVAFSSSNCKLHELLKKIEIKKINLPFLSPRAEVLHSLFNIFLLKKASIFINLHSDQYDSVVLVQGDIEIGSIYLKAGNIEKKSITSYIPYAHSASKLDKKFSIIRDFFIKRLYSYNNKYITIYEGCENDIKKMNGSADIHIIRNKVRDLAVFKKMRKDYLLNRENKIYKIFLVGRVSFNQKGHDRFVSVLSMLDSKYIDKIEINFLGDGDDLNKLKKLVNEKIPYISVVFLGWLKEPWEKAFMADMVVIPSRFEGVPLVMLEALNLNIDILASDIDGMQDYLDEKSRFSNDEDFKRKLEFFFKR